MHPTSESLLVRQSWHIITSERLQVKRIQRIPTTMWCVSTKRRGFPQSWRLWQLVDNLYMFAFYRCRPQQHMISSNPRSLLRNTLQAVPTRDRRRVIVRRRRGTPSGWPCRPPPEKLLHCVGVWTLGIKAPIGLYGRGSVPNKNQTWNIVCPPSAD